MNIDDLFRANAQYQAEVAKQEQQQAAAAEKNRRERAERMRNNAIAIDKRIRSAYDYLSNTQFESARRHGYEIQHHFLLSDQPPTSGESLWRVMRLFMHKGSMAWRPGDEERPYVADNEFILGGIAETGEIRSFYKSYKTGEETALDAFASCAELTDEALQAVFAKFVQKSLAPA